MDKLKAPFPWFGGKSRVAAEVWARFGEVKNYVEPFAGSLAVLLGRPHAPGIETVNDLDGYVANFWRAMTKDPEAVAAFADWPVNECDLHARHIWLVNQKERFVPRLMGDPDFYDAKIAGWWVWGLCSWIGTGWCSGDGPWVSADGELVRGDAGRGINRQDESPRHWIMALADRLRRVRVACGDWARVVGESPTTKLGLTGVFLDPPYEAEDYATTYTHNDRSVGADVWAWAAANGNNPLLRVAVCAYEDGRTLPAGWTRHAWKAQGGYSSQGDTTGRANSSREVIYFSPHCLGVGSQRSLF